MAVSSPSWESQTDETVGDCVDGCVQAGESMESHRGEPILRELYEPTLNLLIVGPVTHMEHNSSDAKEANAVF